MGDIHFVLRFPIKNSRVEASYFRRALGSVTLLRAIIRFLKALNFSLLCLSLPNALVSEKMRRQTFLLIRSAGLYLE
jgi:hypothetical protein